MNQILTARDFSGSLLPADGRLGDDALDRIFRAARTQNAFLPTPVPHALLEEAVDLAKMGPTAVNASPFRIVFVESEDGKAKLKDALSPGNVAKTMSAPVTAIMAYDLAFFEHLPRLFPHMDLRPMFAGNEAAAKDTAYLNGTLQAAYFILALRAVGLDAGPMGGFDKAKVDEAFLAGTAWRSNFLINIGYGDATKLFPRSPRLDYGEIARFV